VLIKRSVGACEVSAARNRKLVETSVELAGGPSVNGTEVSMCEKESHAIFWGEFYSCY
jgi:hypothetical protein